MVGEVDAADRRGGVSRMGCSGVAGTSCFGGSAGAAAVVAWSLTGGGAPLWGHVVVETVWRPAFDLGLALAQDHADAQDEQDDAARDGERAGGEVQQAGQERAGDEQERRPRCPPPSRPGWRRAAARPG